MTQHLDEGVLYALLDDELSPVEEQRARAHIASCRECSASFQATGASSTLLSGGLRLLDVPRSAKPFVTPAAVAASPRWSGAALARAAALLLMIGGAASAAVPGSPLHSWLEDQRAGSEPGMATTTVAAPEPAPLAVTPAAEAGAGVAPEQGVLRISVSGAQPGLSVRVVLTDTPRGGVYALGADSSVRFETAPGALAVADAGMTPLRIEVPRSASDVSVTINGRRYITKDGEELLLENGTRGGEVTFEVAE
mgnify:CR=1 FL=1